MNPEQFQELISKLEEIRCGIINVESVTENTPQPEDQHVQYLSLREAFFARLEVRTGWGRNQVKSAFDEAVAECMWRKQGDKK